MPMSKLMFDEIAFYVVNEMLSVTCEHYIPYKDDIPYKDVSNIPVSFQPLLDDERIHRYHLLSKHHFQIVSYYIDTKHK